MSQPYRLAPLLLLIATAGVARADDAADAERRARSDKTAVAVRAGSSITIDGVLDDATWQAALFVDDFAQKEPTQDAAPADRTEVALAFDDDALYVAARMHLADPGALDRPMTRRDDSSGAERIIVSIDPYRSKRTAYSFAVTAAGVRIDYLHTDDDERARDYSWNPVWRAAVTVGDGAWIAEMRIPLSQLRFPADATPVWGINFNRFVPRNGEDDFWIVVPKDRTGWSSYFGELRGLDGIEPAVRLEVLPYVAGDLQVGDAVEPGGNAGVDVKLGVGPTLTLDGTVNPDFGQVEADPAVVNLGAYEVTFPERRPFFIEGAQIFSSQPRRYFYSRRIGARSARILGAVKLTGLVAPKTNIGMLAAVTASARDDAGDQVAPLSGWGVFRLERELAGAGVGGVTLTGVSRHIDDPLIRRALPRAAVTGGTDLRLRLDDGNYEVLLGAGGSLVAGSPEAIGAIQTASAHYFQRPDADHVELDPEETLLAGWHADAYAAKRAGDWRFEGGAGAESPELELNDLGTLQSADDIEAFAFASRVDTTPGKYLHGWSIGVGDIESWNFGGVHKPSSSNLEVEATLPSFYRMRAAVSATRPGLSDDATRGGPLMGVGWGAEATMGMFSPGFGALTWSVDGGASWSQTDATGAELGASVLWRVFDRLRLNVAPRLRAGSFWTQYVDTIEGTAGGADTFGTRYVFSTLELREASLQLRAQVSLSPDLTIDGYIEPFASSGRYQRFGELRAPGARELRRYDTVSRADGVVSVNDDGDRFELGDPDFTYLSLRSTVVLRWEVRPGSVLFAVWQQDRSHADAAARGLGGDVFGDVFTAPGEHTFAVKLSWWWSP